jgi:L-ascorbate metabolism protein UlaG (beta-lactamase superfamily)
VHFDNLYPLDAGESVTLDGVRIEAVRTVHGPISIPILGFRLRRQPGENERVGLGAMGFRIVAGGLSVVNLGDTILLPDWEHLSADVLMLPIGGLGNSTWTMDVDEALEAVKLISPRWVIPCHYSVPLLWKRRFAMADDQRFKREVERLGVECNILNYGETLTI